MPHFQRQDQLLPYGHVSQQLPTPCTAPARLMCKATLAGVCAVLTPCGSGEKPCGEVFWIHQTIAMCMDAKAKGCIGGFSRGNFTCRAPFDYSYVIETNLSLFSDS